jgi:uncharacterized membrane protein
MKPKTTLNLSKDYFTNLFQKLIMLLHTFLYKKVRFTIYKLLTAFIFLIITTNSYSQSCQATLKVEKNRSTKSVSPEGTYYKLEISNTGITSVTYKLSAINVNNSCSNNDGSSTSSNVNLNISFTDEGSNPISEISLNPGQTTTFLTNVNIPLGTAINKWNCTQIYATATSCSNYSVNIILHTLVSDPNQE